MRDLVDTFNNRLNELKAIASLKADIRDNVKKKEELDKAIKVIQDKIESGRSAKTLSKLIEKKELAKNVTKDINDLSMLLRIKLTALFSVTVTPRRCESLMR